MKRSIRAAAYLFSLLLASGPITALPADASDYIERFNTYADSCYEIPEDVLRIVVAPVIRSRDAPTGEDGIVRPLKELENTAGDDVIARLLSPPHLHSRVNNGTLVGLDRDFIVQLDGQAKASPDAASSMVTYLVDFKRIGYIDVYPAHQPFHFELYSKDGLHFVSGNEGMSSDIDGYDGGQCVLRGVFIYKD